MVCSLPGSITRVLIQYRVVLEYERELRCFLNPSFPASFEVRTQTAYGHSNITRPPRRRRVFCCKISFFELFIAQIFQVV